MSVVVIMIVIIVVILGKVVFFDFSVNATISYKF